MWILKRYYLIDGINQLFAVIYLYLFMLEYFSSPAPLPPLFSLLHAKTSRYFYIYYGHVLNLRYF